MHVFVGDVVAAAGRHDAASAPHLYYLWEPGGMLVGVVRVESSAEARKRVVGVLA
ncbi:hypothetical protein [Clavibacter michiganensis]|uniref:hypothetical protein n=1 Tax=Clavibacter michiganensis TaxID=28447 RepID=UPI0026DB6471|nr:hypothetical protein [Clavibacter michiganensis]MDO4073586.1 hypothetical protein [Clavibacter michiganensis]